MGFAPDWLELREPADHAARDAEMLTQAATLVADGDVILDLGSGTGSTARAFADQGFTSLNWRFFDNDPALLAIAQDMHPTNETRLGNVAEIDDLPLEGVGLVTASALLDLMPQSWIEALAKRLADAQIPFYAALSYDGQMTWTPAHPQDSAITTCFNTHQRSDKGIGAALGPDAGETAYRVLTSGGFDVAQAESPWQLGPDQADMQQLLLEGIATAAQEAGHPSAAAWLAERREKIDRSKATIGHTDILALPRRPQS